MYIFCVHILLKFNLVFFILYLIFVIQAIRKIKELNEHFKYSKLSNSSFIQILFVVTSYIFVLSKQKLTIFINLNKKLNTCAIFREGKQAVPTDTNQPHSTFRKYTFKHLNFKYVDLKDCVSPRTAAAVKFTKRKQKSL